MNGFRRSGDDVVAKFGLEDAELLATLARQVAVLIADRGEPGDDPVLDRLLPDAYRDSAEDAAEFRRFTESELGDQKVANALAIAESLDTSPGSKNVTVRLDAGDAMSWLRALTDIRLALGTRLGLTDEGVPDLGGSGSGSEHDADQSALTYAIYSWLSAVQESLVHAVDR
jgi:hypothetical protein